MGKRTNDFYDKFSALYPVVDVFLRPQKLRLFEEINRMPPGKLLDVGVGTGKHLPQYTTHQVTGIDTSAGMLEHAAIYKKGNVQLMLMDGEALAFENEIFDYVVLSHVIAVVNEPDSLLMETYRVLKPGGTIFILNHFTPDNPLKYIDKAFRSFAKALHFRSVFYASSLPALKHFRLVNEFRFRFSYFKLLILKKP